MNFKIGDRVMYSADIRYGSGPRHGATGEIVILHDGGALVLYDEQFVGLLGTTTNRWWCHLRHLESFDDVDLADLSNIHLEEVL